MSTRDNNCRATDSARVFDLHSHSDRSDGQLSPEQLVVRASERNVDVIALTDHDTVGGIEDAKSTALRLNLQLVEGIEFSCLWNNRTIHILGLNIDSTSDVIKGAETSQLKARAERAELIARQLEKSGISGALEGARRYANGGAIGRVHFANHLVESRVVSNHAQAFKRHLGAGKPGDVKTLWPDYDEVIQWIHASGGKAVLAHPAKYKMTRTKLRAMLDSLCAEGLDAMEVVSGRQTPLQTQELAALANRFGLLASTGSDFHAPGQVWQELGSQAALPRDVNPIWQAW